MKTNKALSNILKGEDMDIKGLTKQKSGIFVIDLEQAYTDAKAQLELMQKRLDECTSDFGYWGYRTEVGYLSAVTWILESARLVGSDNLPYVEPPSLRGITMEVAENVKDYGRQMLERTKELLKD